MRGRVLAGTLRVARFVLEQLEIKARAAHRDEEGGSMVFGTITMFTLALFTVLVFHVGMNSGDRIALQGAADAGAYSGALVEAEALESIAFLNDGMAFVYYTTLRYAVDACVYSTLRAFQLHDEWIRQKQSQRLQPVAEGPWAILDAVSIFTNNPGARKQQQYDKPMDHRGEKVDYDWAVVGKGSPNDLIGDPSQQNDGDGKRRYIQAATHAVSLIPRGKKWLADIHWAERIILAGAPKMAARRAVKVAMMNGADAVSVSDDLDRVFRLETGAGGNDQAGFNDGRTQGGSTKVDDALSQRYQDLANPLEGKARKIPSWFDASEGKPKLQGYSQVRLCWNKRDWDHSPEQGKYQSHNPGYPGLSVPPNGHWHVLHAHNVDLDLFGQLIPLGPIYGASLDHDFGHGVTSGDDAEEHKKEIVPGLPLEDPFYMSQSDLAAPTGSHHAAQKCPTCFALKKSLSSRYTDVSHVQDDGKDFLEKTFTNAGKGPFTEVRFDGQDDTFPRPIRLKGNVFRAGISVAAWRQGRGFGKFFPASPWGQLAIASAQIGVRDQKGVVMVAQQVSNQSVTVSSFNGATRTIQLSASGGGSSSAPENFYLGASQAERGLRFGARLVPIARDLTWAPTSSSSGNAAAQGLGALVNGKRWYFRPQNENANFEIGDPSDPPKALDELKKVLDIGGAASDFAH